MAVQLPNSFSKRMQSQLGTEYDAFLLSLSETAATSVRINRTKLAGKPNGTSIPWCDTGFYLDERPLFTLDPLLDAGVYYVQEASSMFLERIRSTTEF